MLFVPAGKPEVDIKKPAQIVVGIKPASIECFDRMSEFGTINS